MRRKIYFGTAIVLATALCLSMTACGAKKEAKPKEETKSQKSEEVQESEKSQITMEQIVEANSTEKLLSHYHSVYEDSGTMKWYVESEFRYSIQEGREEIQMPDTTYGLYDGEYCGVLVPGGAWNYESDYYARLVAVDSGTNLEEIKKIEDNGDTLMIYTVLPSDSLSDVKELLDIDYEDGDSIECTYKLDAETLAILECESVQCHTDGTKEEPLTAIRTYDAPRPEGALVLLERLSDPENLRTVTMIFEPGTAEECSESVSVPKGESVHYANAEGEAGNLFTDSACTDVYTGYNDPDEDLTIYVKFE